MTIRERLEVGIFTRKICKLSCNKNVQAPVAAAESARICKYKFYETFPRRA